MDLNEIDKLIEEQAIIKHFIKCIPVAIWTKEGNNLNMRYLNDLYEETFLIPNGLTREDYIGRNDFDVYPKKVAQKFVENDKKVIREGEPTEFEEIVPIHGEFVKMRFIKFPFTFDGKLYVGGMALQL